MTAPRRLPPPVRPGDRVALAAVSGPVPEAKVEAMLDAVRELGFEPVAASNLRSRHDLFAGRDDERLAALHELASDDSIAAVIFARGGHGLLGLLPRLDWELLVRRPRAWVGYSDVTPFLLNWSLRSRCVCFHGPMGVDLARGLHAEERISLLESLGGRYPQVLAARAAMEGSDAANAPAEGTLLGGCLSLLSSTLGTPWQVGFAGAILVLEDVEEPLYRIDRMLTHLSLSGSLHGVRGVALGQLRGSDESAGTASSVPGRVRRLLPGTPILHGMDFGHAPPNRTLPIGLDARIDPALRTLSLGVARAKP